MKTRYNNFTFILALCIALMVFACDTGFLDLKRDRNAAIPGTVADFQAILDNHGLMNNRSVGLLGHLGVDESYATDADWDRGIVDYERQAYLWAGDAYTGTPIPDWDYGYKRILHCNIVLDGLAAMEDVRPSDLAAFRLAKGSALFFRAFNFFELAKLFCVPYPVLSEPSAAQMGIPLRLEADITARSVRSSLQETYQQVLSDLEEAAALLPVERSIEGRPSKPAAHALLARVYLQVGHYREALPYADSCLHIYNELVDFNAVDTLRATDNLFDLVQHAHPEVVFMASSVPHSLAIQNYNFRADTSLLASYATDDLRRTVYFKDLPSGTQLFRASYSAGGVWFTGLAVDELLLIKAECHARLGQTIEALEPLNRLLAHRMDGATFSPLTESGADAVLDRVIAERRKELVYRGLRWGDLRRLNQEVRHATTLSRVVKGRRYELAPGDVGYTWPIPDEVIQQSGMPQNER